MIAKSSSYLLGMLLCLFCGGVLQSAWAYNTEDLRRLKVQVVALGVTSVQLL